VDTRYLSFVGADPDFYEAEWAGRLEDRIVTPACGAAESRLQGPWTVLDTGGDLPANGWKVHVSCRPERAVAVVSLVVGLCLARGVSCKHLSSVQLVAATQAKYADPLMAGKVITAYPRDEAELSTLVTDLTELLRGEPGARIPGDVPVLDAPVSVRFGAFHGRWYLDEAGRTRPGRDHGGRPGPDDRTGRRPAPDAPPSPTVRELRRRAEEHSRTGRLEISDVSLLHRSNAGGVYRGTWVDGSAVILKEARHHTGFDLSYSDAAARLRQEHRALERLSGTGAAPEPLALVTVGDSDFLVMSDVQGRTLTAVMAAEHPGTGAGADPAAYCRWQDRVTRQAAALLDIAHSRGVAHGDVHAGNVIDTVDGVCLIDFESSSVDGFAVAEGITTPLSAVRAATPEEADAEALRRMGALLRTPMFSLTARRPDLEQEILGQAPHDLGLASTRGPLPGGRASDSVGRLVRGIMRCASPDRPDRLFPGDIETFLTPGAGLGLLHGAAGVLLALREAGEPVDPSWVAWIRRHASAGRVLSHGLGDGVEGTAMALALLGEHGMAGDVVDEHGMAGGIVDEHGSANLPVPWWGRGTIGLAVAYAELAGPLCRPALMDRAAALCSQVVESHLAPGTPQIVPAGYRAGLLSGWSGVALGLLRVAELVEDDPFRPDGGAPHALLVSWRKAALAAVERECDQARWRNGTLLTVDARRRMPYLGTGSAALALAADAVAPFCPPERLAGLRTVVRGVVEGISSPVVACAGVLHGRAGLALTLGRLSPGSPAHRRHQQRLAWYRIPLSRTALASANAGAVSPSDGDLVLGDQLMRCSADIGTGAAGVLLASLASGTAARRPGAGSRPLRDVDPLTAVFRLPRGGGSTPAPTPATGDGTRDDSGHHHPLTEPTVGRVTPLAG
jgi:tRNA A-37 threonylcarbamoyl transferase component Bud32